MVKNYSIFIFSEIRVRIVSKWWSCTHSVKMAVSMPKLCMFFTLQFKDDLGKSLPSHQSGPKALPKVLEPEGTLNDELSTREPGQDLVQENQDKI